MIQFYAPEIEKTGLLPEQESVHCCRVLRLKEGDTVYVTDGKGKRFECVILEAHAKHTALQIISQTSVGRWWGFNLEICVAPSKNIDRMEWLVQKCVEIGVNRIVLMKCRHSERKVVRSERLEKIAVSAMNQSLKTNLVEITEVVDFNSVVTDDFPGSKFFGYCDDSVPLRKFAREYRGGDVRIMIGPEGDFSPDEVNSAIGCGYLPVTFGGSRLRLETAALYAAVAAHVIADD